MLAFKAVNLGIGRSLLRPSVKQLSNNAVRAYRETGKGFTRRSRLQQSVFSQGSAAPKKVDPYDVGRLAAAGGAVAGLGALCYYGMGMSNETGALDRAVIWPDYVRARIRDTYLYLGASCGAIAGSAIAVFRSPTGHKFFALCQRHPIMSTVGLLGAMFGSCTVMMSVPYNEGLGAKQIAWLVNCGVMGVVVAPLASLGGALAMRAMWYTAGIVGGLSTIAVTAPSDKFLNWAGPLGIGLGGVFVASLASSFLPATTTLGMGVHSFALYGGLLLFSAFLLYDTQKVIRHAETLPPTGYGVRKFDPINSSHHIVLDALNIFVRLIQIFAMGGGRRK